MSETRLLNRRSFVAMGGATFIAGCQASPEMLGAAMGGAGKEADFGELVKALHAALDKVADQTKELFLIQASYAEVFGLKKQAAEFKGDAEAIRQNGRSSAKFKQAGKRTEGLLEDIQKELDKGRSLDAKAKRNLERGMVRHKKAVENAWVGGIMIAKVVLDARSAKKPQFTDFEALGYVREILADGPMAMKFIETSKSTYEGYSDAFEFKAKIRVPSKPQVKPMMGGGRRA